MAYLDMYNSEHKMSHHHHHHHHHHRHSYNHNHYHNNHNHNNNNQLMQVSPRISFSNDFVDAQQAMRQQDQATRASSSGAETASSDFEFSVTSYSMMSADELFFKGRLLPFKDNNNLNAVVSRGGEEGGKDDTTSSSQRVTTLREELRQEEDDVTFRPAKGTRWKSLLGLKRAHSGSHSRKAENKAVLHEDAQVSKTSAQELMNEEMEIGI